MTLSARNEGHDSDSMSMVMVFTTSSHTPLYANSWTPQSSGAYAGTCIFLLLLAMILRSLLAVRTILGHRWAAAARKRRFVLVKGQSTEAGRIDSDPNAKMGSLVTAQGVEENVKLVQARSGSVLPFRLSVDVPRAILTTIIVGVSYLLMLAVMTMNVGYFLSVLAGVFVAELAVGRYVHSEEHDH